MSIGSFLNRFSALFLPLLFFIIGLATLYDYGMNWDSPVHFARGQAYLRYILTGKTNYNGLPQFCMNKDNLNSRVDVKSKEVCDRHRKSRVSEYESSLLDFNWAVKNVYGHPAFNGLMLALSNSVFFKQLGWVEDIPSYHLYSLFTTFILALTVSVWTKQTFGIFASIIAVLTIYSFPLLSGEQHFNIKDPPMAAFFTLSIYLFWVSIVKKKPIYLMLSALSGGASFGTKFNFVFAPFILLPWIIIAYGKILLHTKTARAMFSGRMLLAFFLYPIIVFLVFFLSWPALWQDPLNNIFQSVKYYKDIGGSTCSYPYLSLPWFTKCSQFITIQYLLFTTPPFTIFLFAVGFIISLIQFRRFQFVTVLWLSFFFMTIVRVTFSISNIYGGLRQIMEFIAPMAMISGLGALFLREKLIKILSKIFVTQKMNQVVLTSIASLIIIVGFISIFMILIKLHPNENIYFNSFIGGLRGAAEKNFPGYGNTYGNAYLQGIKWLNQYAEPNPKFALVSGNMQNIPRGILREDIDFANGYRSGYNQEGEYQMLLVMGQDQFSENFRYKYLNLYLDPVYDLKAAGVSLIKIWKNDSKHIKVGTEIGDEARERIHTRKYEKEMITITLNEKKSLKALGFTFPSIECKNRMIGAKIYVSADGKEYLQKADEINGFTEEEMRGFNGDFVYLFPGDKVQFIKITLPVGYPCKLKDIDFSVFTFNLQSIN